MDVASVTYQTLCNLTSSGGITDGRTVTDLTNFNFSLFSFLVGDEASTEQQKVVSKHVRYVAIAVNYKVVSGRLPDVRLTDGRK